MPLASRIAALVLLAIVVAGCASTERPRLGGAGPPTIKVSQFKDLSTAPVRGNAAVFAFRPITGAPAEMIFALEDSLEREAAIRRINVAPVGDPSVTYTVQGYISAVGDPHSALMVYVWDIFDQNGVFIHRLTGQEVTGGSGADPWAGVSKATMAAAARQTMDAMATWVRA